MRSLLAGLLGYVLVAGGLLLLAFSQVNNVLPDANLGERSTAVNGAAGVLGSALLITAGLLVVVGSATPLRGWRKAGTLAALGSSLFTFLGTHTLLIVNGASYGGGPDRWIYFTSSYFFHASDDLTFGAVYVLFFFTVFLLALIVGCLGYLLFPGAFGRLLGDRRDWARNESLHVIATLFLVANLAVLVLYIGRVASATNAAALARQGLMADLLVPLYLLTALLLGLLALTVGTHAFLLNWGHRIGPDRPNLGEALRSIARVERGLVLGGLLTALLILLAPELPTRVTLSRTFVFNVSPRGLAYATFLFLTPYFLYAITQRRLEHLLRTGAAPRLQAPFSDRSLRLVTLHLLGTVLLLTLGAAARWDAIFVVLTLAAWTGGVFLAHAVRWETRGALPRMVLRGGEGPIFYAAFLVLATTTGLMVWGVGNTFEAAYLPSDDTIRQTNEDDYGLSILYRLLAVSLLVGSLILTLDLLRHARGVGRRFLPHYLAIFLLSTVAAYTLFSVGIWNTEAGGVRDAYTGFSFHKYYTGEKILAAVFLVVWSGYVFWAIGRMFRPLLHEGRPTTAVTTIQVQW